MGTITKFTVYLKWLGIMVVKLLAWPYSFLLYPIAYPLRDPIREKIFINKTLISWQYWLWLVLDDENDYGEDWYFKVHGEHINFIGAWKWSFLRNNSWNLNQELKLAPGKEIPWEGYSTAKTNDPLEHCRFKWEILLADKTIDGWTVNQGDRLSERYSTPGKAFCWYDVYRGSKITRAFRASYAGVIFGLMINYKLGFNKRGEALLDVKFQKYKAFYSAHWENDIFKN